MMTESLEPEDPRDSIERSVRVSLGIDESLRIRRIRKAKDVWAQEGRAIGGLGPGWAACPHCLGAGYIDVMNGVARGSLADPAFICQGCGGYCEGPYMGTRFLPSRLDKLISAVS